MTAVPPTPSLSWAAPGPRPLGRPGRVLLTAAGLTCCLPPRDWCAAHRRGAGALLTAAALVLPPRADALLTAAGPGGGPGSACQEADPGS